MHQTKTTEKHSRYGTTYVASCECGWKVIGLEYRTQADRACRGHETQMSTSANHGNGRYR